MDSFKKSVLVFFSLKRISSIVRTLQERVYPIPTTFVFCLGAPVPIFPISYGLSEFPDLVIAGYLLFSSGKLFNLGCTSHRPMSTCQILSSQLFGFSFKSFLFLKFQNPLASFWKWRWSYIRYLILWRRSLNTTPPLDFLNYEKRSFCSFTVTGMVDYFMKSVQDPRGATYARIDFSADRYNIQPSTLP